MTTLIEFLEARLREDQEAAERAAAVSSPRWIDNGSLLMYLDDSPTPFAECLASVENYRQDDALGHIALHDPARVLREVAAKRAIIAAHKTTVSKQDRLPFDPFTGEPAGDQYEVECEICGWVDTDPNTACLTVRHLAAIYSDHPEFDPEWTVTA